MLFQFDFIINVPLLYYFHLMWKLFNSPICNFNFVSVINQVMKYYAVSVGRKPGVYKTWKECELQVKSFSGAKYKKFTTLQDAQKFASSCKQKSINAASLPSNSRKRKLSKIPSSCSRKEEKHYKSKCNGMLSNYLC